MKKFLLFISNKAWSEKFLVFSQKSFTVFQETELYYILNPGIFTTQGIFRTLSSIYDGIFCKIATQHISALTLKYFPKNTFLKKFIMFFQKKAFLIFSEMKPCTFQQSSKNKNSAREDFSGQNFCYTSENGGPEKISYIFSKESFSYILEKGNPEKIPYILGNRNPKKYFIFQGELSLKKFTETLKKLFIFRVKETPKKSVYFRRQNFCQLLK